MSDERISLELLGARILTLTAGARDLQHRFSAMEIRFTALEHRLTGMENRFSALEGRFALQEERMSAMLGLIVRIAERVDRPSQTPSA